MFILDLKNIKPINIYIKLILSYNNYLKFNTSFRNKKLLI